MYLLQRSTYRDMPDDFNCPFSDREKNICAASLSSMIVGPHNRKEYCFSENYDNCPMFLAKIMRKR
ncbi:MAG: hypothetical protein M0Z67_15435 [Nitrospiraceae bacterium]|nr:hypothetical protein [Nitrospiraceae bacterium]